MRVQVYVIWGVKNTLKMLPEKIFFTTLLSNIKEVFLATQSSYVDDI